MNAGRMAAEGRGGEEMRLRFQKRFMNAGRMAAEGRGGEEMRRGWRRGAEKEEALLQSHKLMKPENGGY